MTSDILRLAYKELENITPVRFDCGNLCEKACCKDNAIGGDACGMWLLPYEDELYLNEKDFSVKNVGEKSKLLICSGNCFRNLRPFACRIFPYYAKLSENNGKTAVKIKLDPRSENVCPIFRLQKGKMLRPRVYFLRAAKRAIRILLTDENIKRELFELSEDISEIELLRKKLLR